MMMLIAQLQKILQINGLGKFMFKADYLNPYAAGG